MALYLLYLCQIVFGSPPNTSVLHGLFQSMIHWNPLDGIKAATDLTVLLRIEKPAILSNRTFLAFPGSEAHFEIG